MFDDERTKYRQILALPSLLQYYVVCYCASPHRAQTSNHQAHVLRRCDLSLLPAHFLDFLLELAHMVCSCSLLIVVEPLCKIDFSNLVTTHLVANRGL
jgi:hypothetical protein